MAVAGNQIIIAVSSQQFPRHSRMAAALKTSRETQIISLTIYF
jgi:hypothetical protein